MKLSRDLSSAELEKALHNAFGDQFVRQLGSQRRLTTQTGGEHHLTIPNHDPLRLGTLRAVLAEVMAHHRLTLEQVLHRLDLG